jgi:PAS domain-containing protein
MAENVGSAAAAAESDTNGVKTSRVVTRLSDGDIDAGVMARLRTVVSAQPDAIAVIDPDGPASFADLAAGAADVAEAVVGRAGTGGEPVALLCGHRDRVRLRRNHRPQAGHHPCVDVAVTQPCHHS